MNSQLTSENGSPKMGSKNKEAEKEWRERQRMEIRSGVNWLRLTWWRRNDAELVNCRDARMKQQLTVNPHDTVRLVPLSLSASLHSLIFTLYLTLCQPLSLSKINKMMIGNIYEKIEQSNWCVFLLIEIQKLMENHRTVIFQWKNQDSKIMW